MEKKVVSIGAVFCCCLVLISIISVFSNRIESGPMVIVHQYFAVPLNLIVSSTRDRSVLPGIMKRLPGFTL